MLTDNDITEILAVRRDQGSTVAFALLDERVKARRSAAYPESIVSEAIDVMADALIF